MKKIIFSSSAIWWKISNNLFGLFLRKNVFELGIRINLSIHCSGLQLIKQWFDTLLFFLISLIKKEFQYLYNLTEKISINNYETFFRLRSHQCAPPPEEAAALLLVAGLRSSMPLPYSVEQISSRLVSCLWFWRLQPHKKTRQIDLCIVLDLFWWPRGSQRRSTVTSRGCGAATGWTVRYFRKDQRPVQDFLRSEVAHPGLGQTRFLIKNHTKARGLYKCIHQLLIKKRKESKQLCFSNFSLPWFCLKSYSLCDK